MSLARALWRASPPPPSPPGPRYPGADGTVIQRVYALQGSNLKDDFYAAVNKEWLDSSTILPGSMINGTLYEITAQTNTQVAQLILGIAASEPGGRLPRGEESKISTRTFWTGTPATPPV